jgi:ASCH domain
VARKGRGAAHKTVLKQKIRVAAQKAVLAGKLNAAVRHGTDIGMNALSIRQPYVEQILQATKRIEFRSMPTRITGQVLIYASLTPGPAEEFAKMRMRR